MRPTRRSIFGCALWLGAFLSILLTSVPSWAEVTIAFWGDSRLNADNATAQILKVLQKDPAQWDIIVHSGDFTQTGSDADWRRSLGFPGMKDAFVKGKFFMCTSNHDANKKMYDKYTKGVLPTNDADGTTHFFHHQQGNVHILACDGYFTKEKVMVSWLKKQLKDIPKDDWIIGLWHNPCYGDITYKSSYLSKCRAWLNLLQARGGHLILHGHAHVYLRTHPLMPDGKVDHKKGMVHIINGTGGASFKPAQKMTKKTAFTPKSKSFATICFLTFDKNKLHVKTIDARAGKNRAVIDEWTWTK